MIQNKMVYKYKRRIVKMIQDEQKINKATKLTGWLTWLELSWFNLYSCYELDWHSTKLFIQTKNGKRKWMDSNLATPTIIEKQIEDSKDAKEIHENLRLPVNILNVYLDVELMLEDKGGKISIAIYCDNFWAFGSDFPFEVHSSCSQFVYFLNMCSCIHFRFLNLQEAEPMLNCVHHWLFVFSLLCLCVMYACVCVCVVCNLLFTDSECWCFFCR